MFYEQSEKRDGVVRRGEGGGGRGGESFASLYIQ